MGVTMFDFLSDKLGYHTKLYVILPGCVNQGKKPAGTLYLLHGGGGNSQDWIRFSSIERYAEEKNFAVVMPEVDGGCFYSDMKYGYPYYQFVTEEVPMVAEKMFPVNTEPENRYVAGFSMGGYGAYKWAFTKPGFFRAAANLSGLSFVTELFAEQRARYQDKEQEKNDVVSLCWGSLEKLAGTDSDSKVWIDRASETGEYPALFGAIGTEDGGYAHAQKYLAYCKEKNVKIYYEEMPGGHEWKVWDTMIVKYLDWIQTL